MRALSHPLSSHNRGFSLIEVLISLVILSVGLLGIAAMVSVALKTKGSSYLRTQALAQAQAIIDRMRSNRASAIAGYYNYTDIKGTISANSGNPGVATLANQYCNSDSVNCSAAQIAQMDMWEWTQDLNNLLGSGVSNSVSYYINTTIVGQFTQVQVMVSWDDTVANTAINGVTATGATAACSAATSTPANIATGTGYSACYNSIALTSGL